MYILYAVLQQLLTSRPSQSRIDEQAQPLKIRIVPVHTKDQHHK
ncbi:hypothetical protein [Agitococcus lubricus]|uniref:Uncharacterized protein n=1 Tax=Agitococcus lubricus TaxID=1077255 RepID=A0A2T5J117_9GAMM|nr:hypothetical protein [Agitococcus lubricus]PTQ90081.1 hypothetical protein C8N29_104120 [Agitococcus lubricus]